MSDAERIWGATLRLHAAVLPRLERVVAGEGLPMSWYDVLLELHTAGGSSTVTELGERAVLSRSRVSRVVDELAGAGLVQRTGNPDDRRSSIVTITPEGTKRFRVAGRAYRAAIVDEFSVLPDAEQSRLVTMLETLLERVRER